MLTLCLSTKIVLCDKLAILLTDKTKIYINNTWLLNVLICHYSGDDLHTMVNSSECILSAI